MLSTILWMTVLLVIPTAQAKTPTEYCTDLTAAGTTYTSITTKTIQGPTNCVNDLQNGNTGSATQYLTSLGNAVSADVSGLGNPDDITTKLDEQRNLKNGIATDIASLCSQADELADILTLIVIRTGSCEQSFEVYKTFSNVLSGPSTTFINQATPVKTELQRILTDVQNGINSVLAVSIVIIGYNTVAKQTESILNPLGMSIADQEAMVQRMLTELTRRMTLVQNSGDLSTLVTKIETDRTSLTAKETEICTVVHDTGNVIGSGFSKVVCISSFDTAMISSIETLVVTFTDSVTNLNALTTTIGSLNTDLGNVMPVTASPTDAPTTESPQDSTTNPQTTVMTTSPATNGVTTEATTMQNIETSAAVTTETSTGTTNATTTFTFRDIEWWYQQFTEFSPEKSLTHWEENQIVIISSLVGALVLLIVIIIVITSVAVYIRRRRRRGKYDNIE